jgi:hypothetical protein
MKQQKLSKTVASLVLGIFLFFSILIIVKVYIDFTAWAYSHTGLKFRYGAYLLPTLVMIIFLNGLIQIHRTASPVAEEEKPLVTDAFPESPSTATVNPDTSQL